ncbi:MAG: hypothetical protein OEO18_11300 [Gammaproteobacteria bacterium]|nr:hypothetical protein [Gammaproteobacteria bacterium]
MFLFAVLTAAPAAALDLFGVALESAAGDELRRAVVEAGMVPIREGGEDEWFDIYDSSAVLDGSARFYLGVVKQGQRFAFAEYEFRGLNSKPILQRLIAKYGAADEIQSGRYLSDRGYRWRRDDIDIELVSDWQNYRFRLSYIDAGNLADLQAERASYAAQQRAETAQVSLF